MKDLELSFCIWKIPIEREVKLYGCEINVGNLDCGKCLACNGYDDKCENYFSREDVRIVRRRENEKRNNS